MEEPCLKKRLANLKEIRLCMVGLRVAHVYRSPKETRSLQERDDQCQEVKKHTLLVPVQAPKIVIFFKEY